MSAPDYVVVGHVTEDVRPDGRVVVGGTAAYAALQAHYLGKNVGLLSLHATNLDLEGSLPGIQVRRLSSALTTTFRNVYLAGARQQFVLERAEPIEVENLPDDWKDAAIAHLGPVAQEVDPLFLEAFPRSLLGVTPQGWMRKWGADGQVKFSPWGPNPATLQRVDMLVIGEAEMSHFPNALPDFVSAVKIVVLTQGSKGATLYHRGQSVHIPPFEAEEVDPTGAGDVFAAAFLIRYSETEDPVEAARFASCAASLSVEKVGLAGVPTAERIRQRLEQAAG